ncbi:hypothetical protein EJB05_07708 [Eragrostis curvula]|uniref:PUM-HD domain-containing protein n=1 Tax=Eragrostis curvula TaxID=38414 RepID=A0A5J9WJE9_9POAL|nr:hypothetical protein EJB05_07708 [Eragrostis curvula]
MDTNHSADSSPLGRSASNNASRLGSSSSSRSSSSSSQRAGDFDADGAGLRSLIRRIKEYGVDQETLHDVTRNLVAFSTHWLGSYAVEACILKCPTPLDRELVAATFAALRDHELAEMVQDEYGSCVLQAFLQSAAKDDFLGQEQPRELAQRIERLPEAVLEQTHAKRTVKAIRRMFTRRGD